MNTCLTDNEALSRQFFDVMMRTSTDQGKITMAVKTIRQCPHSISDAFRRDGNLSKCHIPKMWKQFYPVLEDILRNGLDAAGESAVAKDIAEQWLRKPTGSDGMTPRIVPPDTSASWDDSVRNLER